MRNEIFERFTSLLSGIYIALVVSTISVMDGTKMIFKDKDFIERCIVRLGAILEVNEDLDDFDREHIEQAREMLSRVVGMDLSEEDESSN